MSETQENKTRSALYEKILLTVIIIVAVVGLALTILNAMDKIDVAEWIEDLVDILFWSLIGLYWWRIERKGLAVLCFVTSGSYIVSALIDFLQWING